jgi:hypothetical protein
MKLLLISSSTRKLNDIINILDEDTTYLIIDKYETLDTFTVKLTDLNLNYESIDDVALVFDNNGNRCPLFEFTPEEITDYENLKSQRDQQALQTISEGDEEIVIANPTNIFITSAFINSNEFFSSSLVSVIDYIKTLCSIEEVTIVTKNYLVSRDVKINTKNFNVTNNNISKNLLGIRAVPEDGNIYTADDLYALMQSTATEDMNRSYTLMNDINMSGYESESIGKLSTPFLGSFNGNGKNITINETLANNYFGLFWGIIKTSVTVTVIENLNVIYINNGFNITINPFPGNPIFIGGLIGIAQFVTVQNCNVIYTQNTTLSFDNTGSAENVDLLIGGVFGRVENSNIINCNLIAKDNLAINYIYANNSTNTPSAVGGGFSGSINTVDLSNSYCIFEKDISFDNNITAYGNLRLGAYIGFVNNAIIDNINYNCKSNVSIVCNNNNQFLSPFAPPNNTPPQPIVGFFGVIQNSSNISNVNVNIEENYNVNYTSNRYQNLLGGLCAFLVNNSSMTNCVLTAKNITIDYTKTDFNPTTTSGQSFNIGGLFGQVSGVTINGCNLLCDNLTFNVIQPPSPPSPAPSTANYMNNLRLGGLVGGCFVTTNLTTSLTNSNIYVNKNKTFNFNINASNTDSNNRQLYIGNLVGLCQATTTGTFTMDNCSGFINKYTQVVTGTAVNMTLFGYYYGGVVGSVNFTIPIGIVRNCSVFFGEESSVNASVITPNSFVGGVFGWLQTNISNVENCVAVYNNYKLYASNNNNNNAIFGTLSSPPPSTTNISSISYGTPIDSNGVQDMNGSSTTSVILDIFDTVPKTQWLSKLLQFRQSLDSGLTPSQYLQTILSSTTYTSLFSRNAAIQNAMYFQALEEIDTTFKVIKPCLEDYGFNIPNSRAVKYIIPYIDNIYNLNLGTYYLFQNLGTAKVVNDVFTYSSQTEVPGITFDTTTTEPTFKAIDESYTLPNKKSIKVLGVGSGLVEVTETIVPSKKSNNWWWITILIVLVVILGIFLFIYFYLGYNPFSFFFSDKYN